MPIGRLSSPLVIGVCILLGILIGKYAPWPGGNPGAPSASLARDTGKDPQLNFQHAPVEEVLDLYEQLSGKQLIRDTNLGGVPPVSVQGGSRSKDEDLKLIRATLLLNGVAMIPADDGTIKVITTGTNKNPRSEGLRTYTNAADLPADDQIVSYYMPLTYIHPTEAMGIFAQTAPVHVYGAYVPAPSARAIILTENVDVIRQLIDLGKRIDVPPPGSPAAQSFMLTRSELINLSVLIIIAMAIANVCAATWFRKRQS